MKARRTSDDGEHLIRPRFVNGRCGDAEMHLRVCADVRAIRIDGLLPRDTFSGSRSHRLASNDLMMLQTASYRIFGWLVRSSIIMMSSQSFGQRRVIDPISVALERKGAGCNVVVGRHVSRSVLRRRTGRFTDVERLAFGTDDCETSASSLK